MHLAGAEAEFASFGERADGSDSDNRHWLAAATHYLKSGFGEVFYADPQAAAQIAHNRAVLNSLKSAHLAELGDFFVANKTVLDELAHAIAEVNTMNRDEIAPYLDRVVFKAGA